MLNTARIAELKSEVGEDDFAEVVGLFCEEVEEVLAELSETPQSALAEKLHFLKGSAMNIGLDAVGELCLKEETRLHEDPAAVVNFEAISDTYAASKSALMG